MGDDASLRMPVGDSVLTGPQGCTAMKVRRLARRITQIYDEALVPHDITVGQLGLLATLRRREGISVAALAERLSADASTISRLLKPLEAAGYVTLTPDADDRRARLVSITEAGAAKRRAATAAWQAAQATVELRLGEGRLAALRFLLDDSYSNL